MDNGIRTNGTNVNNSTIHISAPTSSFPIPIAPASSTNISLYSMEDVWKEICLSTLHKPTKTTPIPSSLEGIFYQESPRPQYHSPSRRRRRCCHLHHGRYRGLHCSFDEISTDRGFDFESREQPSVSTVLSLNTRRPPASLFPVPDDDHRDHDILDDSNLEASTTVEFSILPMKRVPHNEDACNRKQRMIKNRESAARSRARKQAYTNELETKVAQLMEENAKLTRQLEKLCVEASAQFPKKQMLSRTLTAPF